MIEASTGRARRLSVPGPTVTFGLKTSTTGLRCGVSYLQSAQLSDDVEGSGYPFDLPAVAALGDVEFAPVTVFVGDNGAGKSTLVEALAVAAGFNPEGGSRNLQFETYPTHSELARNLVIGWKRRPSWGWFLRAETFYGMASHIHSDNDPASGVAALFPDLHNRSHGESFMAIVESRMNDAGLYILDEPESALSFQGQLSLLLTMHGAVAKGAQFIVATHSPVLMAYPGAAIYEFDEDGGHRLPYDDVGAVQLWRNFLDAPERFFHHLFGE